MEISTLQLGFDLATFLSIVGSAVIVISRFNSVRKQQKRDRFADSARSVVIAALQDTIRRIASIRKELTICHEKASSALEVAHTKTPFFVREFNYAIGLDDIQMESPEEGQSHAISEKQLIAIKNALFAQEKYMSKLGELARTMESEFQIIEPFLGIASKEERKLESSEMEARDLSNVYRATIDSVVGEIIEMRAFLRIKRVLIEAYLRAIKKIIRLKKEKEPSSKLEMNSFLGEALRETLKEEDKDFLLHFVGDEPAMRELEVNSGKDEAEKVIKALSIFTDSFEEDPTYYFEQIDKSFMDFGENLVTTKINRISILLSCVITALVTNNDDTAIKRFRERINILEQGSNTV